MSIAELGNYAEELVKNLKDAKARDHSRNRIQKLGFSKDQTYNEDNLEPEEINELAQDIYDPDISDASNKEQAIRQELCEDKGFECPEFFYLENVQKRLKDCNTTNLPIMQNLMDIMIIRNTTDSKYAEYRPPSGRKYDIINNTISEVNADQVQSFPIGKLFMRDKRDDNDEPFFCTASVINTENGNIGLTAAHCLYNPITQNPFHDIMFSPGYDHGQPGPLNLIPVDEAIKANAFDWAILRFGFNKDGQPLQDFTGSLGLSFNVGDYFATTILGYPDGGEADLANDYYVMHDLDLGPGASGSPCLMFHNSNTNLGWMYSNYAYFDDEQQDGLAPIYNSTEFQ
ncbi:1553_t:CDS:2, partial [Acaulospora colombiana]